MAIGGGLASSTELETKTFSVAKLLEAIRAGRVRIPRFQRGFRWNDEDRRLLFDSLQNGYPIGTLLLARGEAPADRIVLGGYAADVPAASEALWVVDGQQRVVTLTMALLEDHSGAYRPVYFDLHAGGFVLGPKRRAPAPTFVPLQVLASSSTLNKWLRDSAMPDELCDRADDIARRVREYTVPAYLVPYDGHDDTLLKQIFARINRRGRALESFEVFQALHAGVSGERAPIDRARDHLAQLGFGAIDGPQIERAALAVAGGDPGKKLVDEVTTLSLDVPALFDRVTPSLAAAMDFLANAAGVPHISLLPYSGALHTLARFFALHPRPHERNRDLLVRWFWRGTLTGAHRTDNRTDRRKWAAIDTDEHASVQRLLQLVPPLTAKDLPSGLSTFRRGTASTDTELLAMLGLEPTVLLGEEAGTSVSAGAQLTGNDPFPLQLVEPPQGQEKTVASFLLHPPITLEEMRTNPPAAELLATHAISGAAFAALVSGDVQRFLEQRTAALVRQLHAFLSERCGFDTADRDRPPLESYFTDEGA